MSSQLKRYFTFHGKSAKKSKEYDFHIPEELTILGKAIAIEYECSKLNGGGDGKKAIYRHKFGKKVNLCMDEKTKRQLYIIGDKVKVTKAGIEN